MKPVLIIGGLAAGLVVLSGLARRRRRRSPMRKAQKEMQRAVGDINSALDDLSLKARKLTGEYKENVEVQMRALEDRKSDLVERMSELLAGAKKQNKKAEKLAAEAEEAEREVVAAGT